jgi:hypothetical protein
MKLLIASSLNSKCPGLEDNVYGFSTSSPSGHAADCALDGHVAHQAFCSMKIILSSTRSFSAFLKQFCFSLTTAKVQGVE